MARNRKPAHLLTGHTNSKSHMEACAKLEAEMIGDKDVVYETSRNGQPWYVLVSGIYASKDEAKRAVTSLPADVQAKNPWAKPLHQVQADLK